MSDGGRRSCSTPDDAASSLSIPLNHALYEEPAASKGSVQDVTPRPATENVLKGRLLIVDDDPGIRENLSELFESAGYCVLTATNATAALEILMDGGADLLLTDYRMPGHTGLELIEAARQRKPGLRAILMTAFGDSMTEIESYRCGALGYVTKPFEADEIVDLVERILDPRPN